MVGLPRLPSGSVRPRASSGDLVVSKGVHQRVETRFVKASQRQRRASSFDMTHYRGVSSSDVGAGRVRGGWQGATVGDEDGAESTIHFDRRDARAAGSSGGRMLDEVEDDAAGVAADRGGVSVYKSGRKRRSLSSIDSKHNPGVAEPVALLNFCGIAVSST